MPFCAFVADEFANEVKEGSYDQGQPSRIRRDLIVTCSTNLSLTLDRLFCLKSLFIRAIWLHSYSIVMVTDEKTEGEANWTSKPHPLGNRIGSHPCSRGKRNTDY